jgi:hypothetical protein
MANLYVFFTYHPEPLLAFQAHHEATRCAKIVLLEITVANSCVLLYYFLLF